jgi:GWxTD domain-containing protein
MTLCSVLKLRSKRSGILTGLFLFFIGISILTISSTSCRLYRLEKKLDPVNEEFLSKVRYIITREEKKIFLELPKSEKEEFREEFWTSRDPDPSTEENEFKKTYFDRIDKANDLFVSEGRPGWLTDRGRIYILFGPPMERMTYPMGTLFSNRCQEIWYYGSFPVVFVDSTCTGQYKLITYDLTALRSLNLMYMHELSKAQERAQEAPEKVKDVFNFNWTVEKTIVSEDRIKGHIEINIPYEAIWFNAEDDLLKTVLEVRLELKDFEANPVWTYEKSFEIAFTEDQLAEKKGKKYHIEIPFVLDKELKRLGTGKNLLYAVVRNQTGNEEAKKVMEFDLSS